ncbi:Hsp20/alpha crystallin family protein [Thiomonas sp. FB-Cd]|uniref:Hsp20/alpha crystallin family protein n=1 Tax=Thiomonas sp. FB-Cd TaxID=1158292 RepID=UPI0004DF3DF0|nr:Hsp20/alpha crystallin family protein [Thiomonas sp. FB-Cd]
MNSEVSKTDQAPTPETVRSAQPLTPAVDIIEDVEGISLYADMPGVPKESLHVQVEGDTLTLRGEMSIPLPQGMDPFYAEMRSSAWERSFTLSRELDPSNIQASMKDGVLSLRIPKAEHAKPRTVEVKLG